MEVHLTPEQLDQLNKLASSTGRCADELVQEAVEDLLAYNGWFRKEVEVGLSQVRHGDLVEDEEVRARINRLIQRSSRQSPDHLPGPLSVAR
jgi:predicted transcriptional regulator